jgi:DNA helicase-2/ATP-dependent DNA helicase PcrA
MMINLSAVQQDIVNHIDGALLVKAGPGSGKTRVVIERIKRLLLTQKRCKILALTFSNMAADEMRNRIEEDDEIANANENVLVSTIHAFCLELVQNRGNLIGLNSDIVLFEKEEDRLTVLRDIFVNDPQLLDILQKRKKPDDFLKYTLSLIADQKKKFISPDVCNKNDPFPSIYMEYNTQLLKQNALDFDDILIYAYRILIENPSLVKLYTSLYKYICVDEAQDLNFAQYSVLKALCGLEFKNIMLVGDEKQSIYGFNGSDSALMSKEFIIDFQPKVYILNENYRSAKAIVAFANKLGNSDSITNYVYDGELSAFSFENEQQEAKFVFSKIQEFLNNGHRDIEPNIQYDDFAVIGRNKYVLANIELLLQEEKIPYFYKKNAIGIENESELMKMFEFGFRILINCQDIIHLKELCKLAKYKYNSAKFTNTKNSIDIISQILNNEKYSHLYTSLALLDDQNFDLGKSLQELENHASNIDDDERYLVQNDVNEWKRHWKKYTSQVARENRSLLSFQNNVALGKTQDVSSDRGIALLTAHMSKGLQYTVVFIIGLTEGTFPDYRALQSGKNELEQEKNNMYVAVTRSKRICYLTYPKIKKMPWGDFKNQSRSRFFMDIPIIQLSLER